MAPQMLAACPLQPTEGGPGLCWDGHGLFCLPQQQQRGGPLQPPKPHFAVGDPICPSSHLAKPLPIIDLHSGPNPATGKVPFSSPGAVGPSCDSAPRGGLKPSALSAEPASLFGGAGAARAGAELNQQTPQPCSRRVSGLQSRAQRRASLVLETPELLLLRLPVSFSFCSDNVSFSHTHMKVIICSNNFASVFMSPIPSANSCNCQHGSTNTSAKDKAIISKHSSLSLHCHHPNHQNPGPLSASFSN